MKSRKLGRRSAVSRKGKTSVRPLRRRISAKRSSKLPAAPAVSVPVPVPSKNGSGRHAEIPPQIFQLELGPMENFSYLVCDPQTRLAAVVDPAWQSGSIIKVAAERNFRIAVILLTHNHPDHVNAAVELARLTSSMMRIHRDDAGIFTQFNDGASAYAVPFGGGDVIEVGGIKISALHTPGHTPGSSCFMLPGSTSAPGAVFTGDTLFVGACGRADLPGSNPRALYESLRALAQLPPETIVYPGHNYGAKPTSTISEQKEKNPYMLVLDNVVDFQKLRIG